MAIFICISGGSNACTLTNRMAFCKAPFILPVLNFKKLIHYELPHHRSGNCCTSVSAVITSLPPRRRGPHPAAICTCTPPRTNKWALLPSELQCSWAVTPWPFVCTWTAHGIKLSIQCNCLRFYWYSTVLTQALASMKHSRQYKFVLAHTTTVTPGFSNLLPPQGFPTSSASDASKTCNNSHIRKWCFSEQIRHSSIIPNSPNQFTSLALALFVTLGTSPWLYLNSRMTA